MASVTYGMQLYGVLPFPYKCRGGGEGNDEKTKQNKTVVVIKGMFIMHSAAA